MFYLLIGLVICIILILIFFYKTDSKLLEYKDNDTEILHIESINKIKKMIDMEDTK